MRIYPRRWRRVALVAGQLVAALVATGLVTMQQAHAEDAPEVITNGTFDSGTDGWFSYGTVSPAAVVDGQFCGDVPAGLANRWDAGMGQNDLTLQGGATYTLQFDARTSTAAGINANVQLAADPFTTYQSATPVLGTELTHYSYTFTVDSLVSNIQVAFQIGGSSTAYTICLDNVSLAGGSVGGDEQLVNGTFDDGTAPWWWTGNLAAAVTNGEFCTPVPGGTVNPWDAIFGQNDLRLVNGVSYGLSFDARATRDVGVTVNVQIPDPPFTQQISVRPILGAEMKHFEYAFTSNVDLTNGQLVFQIGGSTEAWTLCVDNISLVGGVAPPVYVPDTGPRVRVNQVGYLPKGPKNATIVTTATDPVPWQLKDSGGAVVASGNATPRGEDAASGQNVQTVDFSSFGVAGTGYTLVADGETSFPFDISGAIYQNLRSDALSFFYAQRSGIAIDNAILPGYGRPAGHVGVAPNQGDTDVGCQPGVCDYRLNVAGGWYDAGDHGKYVVNGGIATYQLLAEFERTKSAPTTVAGALGDSTLRVPERGNGVPDVLDEARWELEFLLKMQVPAGQPLAGMAHHKMHDQNWTGLPLAAEKDPQLRELHPPSTAATLNLAATAAQAARLFARYDAAFAAKSLAAARTAYAAAKANPAIYASPADGNGGGTYDDTNVTDEFYWAAAELFITTGEAAYLADINASPHKTGPVFTSDGFGWQSVAALGRLDLATVPNLLPAADKAAVRASVVAAADGYLATGVAEPYGLPYAPPNYNYVWGSTSNVLNNMVVLASAFDLTGAGKYRDGVVQGMDYLLGRNALNHSFITGYGEKDAKNQHSRLFAKVLDPALPAPPVGSIAGGPNVFLQDPLVAKLLVGCKGQFCYIDDIQSFSTNEIAINWNSALSWVAAFVADQGAGQAVPPGACKVTFTKTPDIAGGFIAGVTVTNTGNTAINGWTVGWSFTGNQKAVAAIGATVSQSGAAVTARNTAANRRINPNRSQSFVVIGTTTLANPSPSLFTLNGKACT